MEKGGNSAAGEYRAHRMGNVRLTSLYLRKGIPVGWEQAGAGIYEKSADMLIRKAICEFISRPDKQMIVRIRLITCPPEPPQIISLTLRSNYEFISEASLFLKIKITI